MSSPILTKSFVTDIDMSNPLAFVADPFIVKDGDTWYIFFEAYTGTTAKNVYGTSSDLINWTYGGKLTIDGADFDASYPFVFRCDDRWFMIHGWDVAGPAGEIRLLVPKTWPNDWTAIKILISDAHRFRDVSIFQYNEIWYILTFDENDITARLFYCSTLYGGTWVEHPSSPISSGYGASRPGGRPISRPGVGVDILIQDNSDYYGKALQIYRLSNLSPTTCTMTELTTSPILQMSGSGWNAAGMHQLDRINANFSVVDGFDVQPNGIYSIGMYQDAP